MKRTVHRTNRAFRQVYGASPTHLLSTAACFALAAYAAIQLLQGRTLAVAVWFIGAAILHDLLLLPLYTGADTAARTALTHRRSATARDTPPRYLNHLRVPAFMSGLLLLVWYPLVLDRSHRYPGATALTEGVYLGRWLLITAGLFALSATLLALRIWRTHRRRP